MQHPGQNSQLLQFLIHKSLIGIIKHMSQIEPEDQIPLQMSSLKTISPIPLETCSSLKVAPKTGSGNGILISLSNKPPKHYGGTNKVDGT